VTAAPALEEDLPGLGPTDREEWFLGRRAALRGGLFSLVVVAAAAAAAAERSMGGLGGQKGSDLGRSGVVGGVTTMTCRSFSLSSIVMVAVEAAIVTGGQMARCSSTRVDTSW